MGLKYEFHILEWENQVSIQFILSSKFSLITFSTLRLGHGIMVANDNVCLAIENNRYTYGNKYFK